jgi:hypothetical protein
MKRTLRCMKHEVALRAMKRACGTLRGPRALRFTRAKASASYWRSQCFTAAKPLLHLAKQISFAFTYALRLMNRSVVW